MHNFRSIWRKRLKNSQGTAFKKEGKMERRTNGSCGRNGSQSSQGKWYFWIGKVKKEESAWWRPLNRKSDWLTWPFRTVHCNEKWSFLTLVLVTKKVCRITKRFRSYDIRWYFWLGHECIYANLFVAKIHPSYKVMTHKNDTIHVNRLYNLQ